MQSVRWNSSASLTIIRSSGFSRGDVKIALHPSRRIGLPCWTRLRVSGERALLRENLFSSLALPLLSPSLSFVLLIMSSLSHWIASLTHSRESRLEAREQQPLRTRERAGRVLRVQARGRRLDGRQSSTRKFLREIFRRVTVSLDTFSTY